MDKTEYLRAFLHKLHECGFPITDDCVQAVAITANVVLNDNSVTEDDVREQILNILPNSQ